MADLIDRISGESLNLVPSRPKINLHRFIGVERLYAFGEWTRTQIATEFDLQDDEATQAGLIADKIDGEIGASNKALYILRVESVMLCTEDHLDRLYHNGDGSVNKAKVQEDVLL